MKTLNDIRDKIQNAAPGAATHMEVLDICGMIVDYLNSVEAHHQEPAHSLRLIQMRDFSKVNNAALSAAYKDWLVSSASSEREFDFDWFTTVLTTNDALDVQWFVRGWLARDSRATGREYNKQ